MFETSTRSGGSSYTWSHWCLFMCHVRLVIWFWLCRTMIGPILGGALKEGFGFDQATTVLAGGCVFTMLLMSFFGVWEYRCGKG